MRRRRYDAERGTRGEEILNFEFQKKIRRAVDPSILVMQRWNDGIDVVLAGDGTVGCKNRAPLAGCVG